MRQRPLGKTSISVTELALGTWGLSGDGYGPVPEVDQDRVIDRALALGIRAFETADVYGHGAMEQKLGQRLPKDQGVVFITKIGTDRESVPPRKRFDRDYVRTAVERSRERLARESVDVVLMHNPATTTLEQGEGAAMLKELKAQGAIAAWGVSAGSVEVAMAALNQGADVLSLAHNAFCSMDLGNLHEEIQKTGVGVLARSVLSHGLLCGYWSQHKQFPSADHRSERWTSDELRRRVHQVQALRALVGGDIHTTRGAALRFVLSNEDVSAAVLGPRNPVQLDQLVREAGKGPPYLPEDKVPKFQNRLADLGVSR